MRLKIHFNRILHKVMYYLSSFELFQIKINKRIAVLIVMQLFIHLIFI